MASMARSRVQHRALSFGVFNVVKSGLMRDKTWYPASELQKRTKYEILLFEGVYHRGFIHYGTGPSFQHLYSDKNNTIIGLVNETKCIKTLLVLVYPNREVIFVPRIC